MLNEPEDELKMEQEIAEIDCQERLQQINQETIVEVILCFIVMACLIYLMIGVLWLDSWILPLIMFVASVLATVNTVVVNNRNRKRRMSEDEARYRKQSQGW